MSDRLTVLIVDDSADTIELIERNLSIWGYRVLTSTSVAEALGVLSRNKVDILVTDMRMPGTTGMDLLQHVSDNYPEIAAMMISGYATIENAVEAVKSGAAEYLAKPFTDEELKAAMAKLVKKLESRAGMTETSTMPFGMMGESSAMRRLFGVIRKAASTAANVLITGESGTGKELVARAIHYGSPRSAAPFVPVNCGGIPETLLESELFGHVKGAFTGAYESRAGFLLTAEGGTVFLDEIGETSLAMQVKLLRVLQDKIVHMVGSPKGRAVDVRVIAATNKDLKALVNKGLFREDLYFRLNVISIEMPPLRERENDIVLLARHFARKFGSEYSRDDIRFTDRAIELMKRYAWPGNVRELENLIQRIAVMTDSSEVDASAFPSYMKCSLRECRTVQRSIAEVEAEHIKDVLESVDGNKSAASIILGIDRKTLREKMRKYSISDSDKVG